LSEMDKKWAEINLVHVVRVRNISSVVES